MSSHPKIERLVESVKSSINQFLGIFDTTIAGSFRKGFAKGVIWVLAATIAIAIPLAIIQQLQPGNHWLENASRLGLAITASAFGQNLNLLGGLGLGDATISIGAHPSLLTFIIVLVAFRAGKSFSTNVALGNESGKNHRFATGLGLGSAVALLGMTWILQGSFGWGNTFASLGLSAAFDFVITLALVAFPAWMGTKLGEVATIKKTAWAWARRATLNFVIIYSVLLAIGLVVLVAYNLVAPQFAPSAPEAKDSAPVDFGQLAIVVLVILAFLPNFLMMLFGAGAGMSVGLDAHAAQGLDSLLSTVQSFLPVPMATSFSINSSYGLILESIVLAVVAVVALIAGAAANRKSGYSPKTGVDFVQALFTVGVIGIFATYLGNISGAWSLPATATTSENSGSVSFGVLLASLALVVSIFVIFAWISGAKAENGIATAFPRWVSRLSGTRTSDRNQGIWVLFGRVSTALLALGLVIYPVTSATVSRVWATTDTPLVLGENLADKVTSSEVDKLKALIGPDVKDEVWFPDEVLKSALPTSSDEQKVTANNGQDKPWVVGNTDATVRITWTKGDKEANWLMPTESKIDTILGLVNHVKFSKANSPIYLNLEVSKFINAKNLAQLKVNGVEMAPGKYAALPGFYRITLPKQDLISATDFIVGTNGETAGFVAGEIAQIPDGGEAKLDTALSKSEKKCESVSKAGKASCFSTSDITGNVVSSSGDEPSKYFQKENSNYKVVSIDCSQDTLDSLLSSKTVQRTSECDVKTTFTTTYFKGQKVKKAYPVYDYVCDDYYDEYWEEWTYDCWYEVTSYNYVSVEQRGAKISSVTYTSEFKVQLSSTGTLKNGKFVVK